MSTVIRNRQEAIEHLERLNWALLQTAKYKTALWALKHPNEKARCGKCIGSGRTASTVSWQYDTAMLLYTIGFYTFEKGNDAPKHGRNGDYIIVYPH